MPSFFCKLMPPRPNFVQDISPVELATMQQHALYWKDRVDHGAQVFALGLVMDPAGVFGMAVIEVQDEAELRAMTANDPAIKAGIGMHYEIHPMPRGVMHR